MADRVNPQIDIDHRNAHACLHPLPKLYMNESISAKISKLMISNTWISF